MKHSGLGIASFIISLIGGVLVLILVVIITVMEVSAYGGVDEESLEVMIMGLCLIMLLFADIVAAGLGIAGICQTDRKKIYAILGTVLSSMTVLGIVFLAIIGSVM